jgi:DNA processing protein
MERNIYTIQGEQIPYQLTQIPQPPKLLHVLGNLPRPDSKILCVVGSRDYSSYGEEVCTKIISGLKGYNICIVSGLARGIDGIAHRAAISAGLQTVAFPGSGLDEKVIYPKQHRGLADEILYNGGGLISEYNNDMNAREYMFPERNRLMAGICDATLIIEASMMSGTLITARLALDYNRNVGIVPGSIFSKLSEGPHSLVKNGAMPITCSSDVLELLGFSSPQANAVQGKLLLDLNDIEKSIVDQLQIEPCNAEYLVLRLEMSPQMINETLSMLEIRGIVEERSSKFKLI